jgi:hypothetical protein
MTNVKAQSSNECQSPNAKTELQRKISDIESLGFDLSFRFCHLTLSCSSILDCLIAIPSPDAIEGVGHQGLFLRIGRCCGKKGELGGGR